MKINRRLFVKKSATIGLSSFIAGSTLQSFMFKKKIADIGVAQGADYVALTKKAVELIGGISKYVPKSASVAILANPQRNNPGAYTKPDIVRATIQMCKDAGASKISCISWLPEDNWISTGLKQVIDEEDAELVITDLRNEELFKPTPVPKGKALKEARIMNTLFDYDVLIDVPVTKDHAGNKFTGTLKNLMGLNSPKNNRTFHKENWATDPDAINHLEQCIADLNTVIHPDLCIVDATEFIITNGPFGPGELFKPQKVVAGTNRVAMDAYCSTLWGLDPKDIAVINRAFDHGLGEKDLAKITILEAKV